ncbi:MAG: hypothetical protein AB7R69_02965 [Candidatus Babeliales bacterium]
MKKKLYFSGILCAALVAHYSNAIIPISPQQNKDYQKIEMLNKAIKQPSSAGKIIGGKQGAVWKKIAEIKAQNNEGTLTYLALEVTSALDESNLSDTEKINVALELANDPNFKPAQQQLRQYAQRLIKRAQDDIDYYQKLGYKK